MKLRHSNWVEGLQYMCTGYMLQNSAETKSTLKTGTEDYYSGVLTKGNHSKAFLGVSCICIDFGVSKWLLLLFFCINR